MNNIILLITNHHVHDSSTMNTLIDRLMIEYGCCFALFLSHFSPPACTSCFLLSVFCFLFYFSAPACLTIMGPEGQIVPPPLDNWI